MFDNLSEVEALFQSKSPEKPIGRMHKIVDKDYFRLLKVDNQINKDIKSK